MISGNEHPVGRPWGEVSEQCQSCAWLMHRGPGPRVWRCQAGGGTRVLPDTPACDRWEAMLDCLQCAACCGPAFDAVEISKKDARRLEGLVGLVTRDGRLQVERTVSNHCSALGEHNLCHVYEDRPRCCREFERGSANCVFARRRVGLSPLW